ncbi:MAG: hypothetical protein QOH04_985 [Sphingomonadales bacterium]|jgi:acetyl esterase/lipase|nr:hypothetical protein [Sphingomonadales bacterium]
MAIGRRELFEAALAAGLAAAAPARTQAAGEPEGPRWPSRERFPLWPGRAPGAPAALPVPAPSMNGPPGARELWLRGIAAPEVHVFRPSEADGSSLLSIPGGGYGFLSVQSEGLDVARRFNPQGVTVFVLVYRLPGEGWAERHLVPLQDAQRAMRLIRARAAEFRIDPARLGILGFSAGGHLAADLAVASGDHTYAPVDAADRQSARPAFAGLAYPVTSLQPRIGHSGSRAMLLGDSPPAALTDARSPLLHVNAQTPPCFVVHAFDDTVVVPENSLEWIAACRAAGVPVEGHLFEKGGHGFGLQTSAERPGSRWPEIFGLWIRDVAA